MKTATLERVRPFRWDVEQFDRLTAKGFFDSYRVELIDGRIFEMAPRLEPHVAGVSLCAKAAERVFGAGYWVRRQDPLRFGSRSKPEPDIAVVVGSEDDFIDIGAPTTALLIIEVADSSLKIDRGRKASLYARHGIADYWIVNLVDRQLEIYRNPIPDPRHRFKFRYEQTQVMKPGEFATPLAAHGEIPVSSLFPRPARKSRASR